MTAKTPRLSFLRRSPSQSRGGKSVLSILKACESLLDEIPFDQVTIDHIAQRARVQVGSVYFFFQDKTSIFLSLIELALLEIVDEYELSEQDLATPLLQYLPQLDRRLARLWDRHKPMLDLFFAYRAHPSIQPMLAEFMERIDRQMAVKLRQEFPSLRARRRMTLARVINVSISSSLDAAADMPAAQARPFRTEWFSMLSAYVASIGR